LSPRRPSILKTISSIWNNADGGTDTGANPNIFASSAAGPPPPGIVHPSANVGLAQAAAAAAAANLQPYTEAYDMSESDVSGAACSSELSAGATTIDTPAAGSSRTARQTAAASSPPRQPSSPSHEL
jgi:hypothetical protein